MDKHDIYKAMLLGSVVLSAEAQISDALAQGRPETVFQSPVPQTVAGGIYSGSLAATGTVSSSLIAKATPGNLYQFSVVNVGTTAATVEVFNSATLPSNGVVSPVLCFEVPASEAALVAGPTLAGHFNWSVEGNPPVWLSQGIVIALSASTTENCFLLTAYASAFISAVVQ